MRIPCAIYLSLPVEGLIGCYVFQVPPDVLRELVTGPVIEVSLYVEDAIAAEEVFEDENYIPDLDVFLLDDREAQE